MVYGLAAEHGSLPTRECCSTVHGRLMLISIRSLKHRDTWCLARSTSSLLSSSLSANLGKTLFRHSDALYSALAGHPPSSQPLSRVSGEAYAMDERVSGRRYTRISSFVGAIEYKSEGVHETTDSVHA